MEIISKLKKNILFMFISVSIVSCVDTDIQQQPLPLNNSIVGIAQRTSNLSILVKALNTTGLINTLSGTGPFTVFAPTDEAFNKFLTDNKYPKLEDVPQSLLKEILLNHVLSGAKKSTDLKTEYLKTLGKGSASETNTLSMYVDVTGGIVKLNGVSKVTLSGADVIASNGVIHIVDAVIGLPTIVTHATANANFSSLVGNLTGPGQPKFVDDLSGEGPFTVFAPNNDAFFKLDKEDLPGGIASVSVENLTKVLQYHVVKGKNVLAATLTNNQEVTPILMPEQKFKIELPTSGPQIIDAKGRKILIIATDVQCKNGVIHVLDKVLLPNF
jgi:uncharacterized surface protein with fasciclin (FAS1) repeats